MAEKIPDKLESILHHEKLDTEPEWSAVEVGVHEDEIVEPKWQGTQADQHDMRILGRVQVLRVSSDPLNTGTVCLEDV